MTTTLAADRISVTITRMSNAVKGVVDAEDQALKNEVKELILKMFSGSQPLRQITRQGVSQLLNLTFPDMPADLIHRAFYSLLTRGELAYRGKAATYGRTALPKSK